MTYKSLFPVLFSLLFFAAPSFAAIPISVDKTETISTQNKRTDEKAQKKVKDKNPNINGLLSFIFGVTGIVIFPPLAVPAVILGIISLTKKEPREWMPIVGIILGGLTVLAIIAVLVFFLLALGL